jgi:hypothetical protein
MGTVVADDHPHLEHPMTAPTPPPPDAPAPAVGIRWKCQSCGAALNALQPGQQGPCPSCGTVVRAPLQPQRFSFTPAGEAVPLPAAAPPERSRWKWVAGVAALGAAAAIVTAGALWVRQPGVLAKLTSNQAAVPAEEEVEAVLDRFLREPAWAGKRAYLLEPERLDPVGAAYYTGRDPDEISAASFAPVHLPETRGFEGVRALRADRPGGRPVIALFKRSGGSWKLDWEMFTQTYDQTLSRFVAEPDFAIRTLKARLSRAFAPAGSAGGFLVEVSDFLDRGQRIEIEVPVGTPLMKDIAAGLDGTTERPVTVEVCWIKPRADSGCVPAVQRLVCWGWRGVTGQPVPAAPAVEAREFILPASAPRDIPAHSTTEVPIAASSAPPVAQASGG